MAKACGFSARGEIMTLPTLEAHTFFRNNFGAQLSQRPLGVSTSLPLRLSLTEVTCT